MLSADNAVTVGLPFARETFSPIRVANGTPGLAEVPAKFGEGVQQVEFRCANVDRATEIP